MAGVPADQEAARPSGYDAERPRAPCAHRPSLRQASGHRATEYPGAMRGHGGSLKNMQINLICARPDNETDDWPAVHWAVPVRVEVTVRNLLAAVIIG